MSSSSGRRRRGPERPTLTEWLLGFIPLPFLWGALLVATLVSPPGGALALYLDTWDIEVALTGLPPGPPWLVPVQVILWVAVSFSVIWATKYMRLQVVQAKDAILPILPRGEETYHQVFGGISSFWPPIVAATLLFAFFTFQAGLPAGGLFETVFDYVLGFVYLLLLSTFIGVYLSSTLGLHALGKQSLKLKGHLEDSMLGLRPLGSLSLSLALPFLGVTAVVALWISANWPLLSNLETLAFVTGLAVVGVVMFFLPLNRVHRVMVDERERELASVRDQMLQFAREPDDPNLESSEATLSEVLNRLRELRKLYILDATEGRLSRIPTWPFDTRVLSRLVTTTLAVITVVVSRFIAIRLFGL